MTETRISTTAPSGGVQAIGKSTECNVIVVRSVGHQGIGAAARSVAFLLIAALFAVSPPQMSAATPDPVLEGIGVMNPTVIGLRCRQRYRATLPSTACEAGRASQCVATRSGDSGGVC